MSIDYLILEDNKITNFKPLNKINFSRLRNMILSENSKNEFDFGRIKLSKKSGIVYNEY